MHEKINPTSLENKDVPAYVPTVYCVRTCLLGYCKFLHAAHLRSIMWTAVIYQTNLTSDTGK